MSESTTGAPVQPESPTMGPIGKLIGIFFSPSKVFEAVAKRPGWDWLVPVAVVVAAQFAYGAVANPKFDVEGAIQQTMSKLERRNPNMTDEQKDRIEKTVRGQIAFGMKPIAKVIGVAVVFLQIFAVGGLYFGAAKAFGRPAKYMAVTAGYAWVLVVPAIYWFLTALVALPREVIHLNEAQAMLLLKSNPAAFLDPEATNPALLTILSYVDIFVIWGFVLKVIGLKKTASFSTAGAVGVVGTFFGLFLLLRIAGALLSSAFGG